MKHLKPRSKKTPQTSSFDFAAQVRQLLSQMPYSLIIKDEKKGHCDCYDVLEHSYDTKCPICAGTGYIPTIIKVRGYHQSAGLPTSMPRVTELLEIGNVSINTETFYFAPNVGVKVGDIIVICNFNENGTPKFETMEFYVVNHCDLKFDETGTNIFYKLSCERDPVDAKIRSTVVYKLQNAIKEVPIE
jgi:Xaa-Pro aminopeptidase